MIKIIRATTVAQSVRLYDDMIPELRQMGLNVVAVSSDGPDLQRVADNGGWVITVEMQRHISPIKDVKSLWQLMRVFRREKPRMVHSMTPKAGLLCMMAGWITGVPVRVHTFTGLVFPTSTGLKKRILMTTDRLTCACATHIIPEGEGVKRDLLNYHITHKPIKVLGYGNCRGINLSRFNREAIDMAEIENVKLRIENMVASQNLSYHKIFTFITIGRLVSDKGINEMVEAFSRLNKELPNTRLILVGEEESSLDPLRPETLAEIEANPAIKAVGKQNDVRPWLAAADCAVLASYREGFPNVVIEAGAMGLPQIVTDINGANEIIIDGENGVIIPPRDADALYIAMREMILDSARRQRMTANARPLIASRYEQSFVRKCLYEFYKEILKAY